jgi:hypothetical protein
MMLMAYAAALGATSVAEPHAPDPVHRFGDGIQLAQIQVQRTEIIRVRPAAPPANRKPMKWKEKGAPPCVAWSTIAAAMVSSPSTIDIVIRGGTRYRVKLERSCQAIDFYSGFYVKATRDGRVCEDRDSIHSRAGGECVIDTFKTLVPAK